MHVQERKIDIFRLVSIYLLPIQSNFNKWCGATPPSGMVLYISGRLSPDGPAATSGALLISTQLANWNSSVVAGILQQ